MMHQQRQGYASHACEDAVEGAMVGDALFFLDLEGGCTTRKALSSKAFRHFSASVHQCIPPANILYVILTMSLSIQSIHIEKGCTGMH
jgi:hypothetical protein